MAREKDERETGMTVIQPLGDMAVPPPDSGFLGKFLQDNENMLKARAMRMSGLLRRINESGQRTENLLRTAAEKMEAAYAKIEKDLCKEGLAPGSNESGSAEGQDE